jgi:hypothetical protein
MHIVNQAYFKVDSLKPIQLKRKMCVIKREPIRLYLIKYLFSDGNQFGTWVWSSGTNLVPVLCQCVRSKLILVCVISYHIIVLIST